MRKSIHTTQQKHFQALLRQIRKEAGLTQVELAARLHTPHSRVSDYERGERRLDLIQLRSYLKVMRVDLAVFVARLESMIAEVGDEEDETLL